ncbi:D-glycero-beta-D-manno-heptose 1-phosphate adenylyltransferase [Chitinophaga sp. ARDCPP14]|uniref:D-glycero-beta-D-manno-heptose 1-phosphate adenylyltransferase n=1 Tax=Chitinophaga sp. ARDCPP14 TaxID=3391139 RepID=UPI003F528817
MDLLIKQICAAEKKLSVLVIGDLLLDVYMKGESHRLCPEATAPVVEVNSRQYAPGGAGNTAINLAGFGVNVTCLGITGNDAAGRQLQQLLSRHHINPLLFSPPERRTICKTRLLAGTQLIARYDTGTETNISRETEDQVIDQLERIYADFDAVLLADYQKGLLTPRIISALERLQQRYQPFLAVDAKNLSAYRDLHPSLVKPNSDEIARLLQLRLNGTNRLEILQQAGEEIFSATGAGITAVTLDEAGALIFERDQLLLHTPAQKILHPQVSGAGDSYISAFTVACLHGADAAKAASVAGMAAAIAVSKATTAFCTSKELLAAAALNGKVLTDTDTLEALGNFYRNNGSKIVFTNGCFDILHSGHVNYLCRARELGDVLIVGINTDESIRRLKGSDRPVNTLAERMQVLSGLGAVTHIIPFGDITDDTPAALIAALRPQVFVKGGDYSLEDLPEARLVEELHGEVVLLPLVKDRSTTAIIRKISTRQLSHPA